MPAIDGEVMSFDAARNVCTLSVGSDDGVRVGFEFTLHKDGEYVSTVVVEAVSPQRSTARTKDGLMKRPPRLGDRASTRL